MKRIFDFFAAITGLVLVYPILLVAVLLVKDDGRPAFFQDRLEKRCACL